MASFDDDFDPNSVATDGRVGSAAIVAGDYFARCVSAVFSYAASSGNPMWTFRLEAVAGPAPRASLWLRAVLIETQRTQLGAICQGFRTGRLKWMEQDAVKTAFLGKVAWMKVKVRQRAGKEPEGEIEIIKPASAEMIAKFGEHDPQQYWTAGEGRGQSSGGGGGGGGRRSDGPPPGRPAAGDDEIPF